MQMNLDAVGSHCDHRFQPVRVAVNGYGVMGKRVAEAVARQADMTLARVSIKMTNKALGIGALQGNLERVVA